MGSPEFLFGEVDAEYRLQLLAIPVVELEVLVIRVSLLVPIGQQGGREIDALAILTLRHHVHLLTDDLFVLQFRIVGIADIEESSRSIHKGVDPEQSVVCGDRDINGQRNL